MFKMNTVEDSVYSFMPEGVIFRILLCLPADVLYEVMRFVCRQWYDIIQSPEFISSHSQNLTTNCLVFDKFWRGRTGGSTIGYIVKPMSDRGCDVKVKGLNLPFACKVYASCNGLVFVLGFTEHNSGCPTYIANPLTKQYLSLPLFPVGLTRDAFSFAYAAASGVYKVVSFQESKWLILTVGVDKAWRQVNIITHIPDKDEEACELTVFTSGQCLSLRGVLYWVHAFSPYMLRFDVETETFGQTYLPSQCQSWSYYCKYGLHAMESSVWLWIQVANYAFEFWLLKDPETGDGDGDGDGQWEKLFDINTEGINMEGINIEGQRRRWVPLGWLGSRRELLVFYTDEGFIVYNVNTQDVHPLEGLEARTTYTYAHGDSLLSLPNCPQPGEY